MNALTLNLSNVSLYLVACLVAVIAPLTHAQDQDLDWNLERDRDGIQVFTRKVADSKFKQVKSVMQIEASLSELVALVRDTSVCPQWADLCKKAEVIEEVTETDLYVYTINDLPWPVSDRDAIAHVLWHQDEKSLIVTMSADLVGDKLPKTRGFVRIRQGTTQWIFSPLDNGRVLVTSLAHIDPAGAIPAWLTNRLLVDSPFDTMAAMRKLILTHPYPEANFKFLTEPPPPTPQT